MIRAKVVIGSLLNLPIQLAYRDGGPDPSFTADDAFTAVVFAGDGRQRVFTPAVSWLTLDGQQTGYDQGQVLVEILPEQSARLQAGQSYNGQVWWTRKSACVARFKLTALPAEGTTADPGTYCEFADMLDQCGWVGQFADDDADDAGFARQRQAAKLWMDTLILRAAPVGNPGSVIARQGWWSWTSSGVDPRNGTGLAVDSVLAGHLAAGRLVTDGPQGAPIVTACACYAIGLILRAQMGSDNLKMAAHYMRRAQSEASRVVAEVDTNGDGRPEYAIALGVTNSRYA